MGLPAFMLYYSCFQSNIPENRENRQPGGMVAIPERGILSVTVPGVLHGWIQALERYETLTLSDVFEDAIYYAENGFSVTEPRIRHIQG